MAASSALSCSLETEFLTGGRTSFDANRCESRCPPFCLFSSRLEFFQLLPCLCECLSLFMFSIVTQRREVFQCRTSVGGNYCIRKSAEFPVTLLFSTSRRLMTTAMRSIALLR